MGAQILDWSRAQVGLMRPGSSLRALAAIVRNLIDTRDGASYFAARVWGVSLCYDLGGGHPLVGRSAPDFALGDGTRLNELLRPGKGCCWISARSHRCKRSRTAGAAGSTTLLAKQGIDWA